METPWRRQRCGLHTGSGKFPQPATFAHDEFGLTSMNVSIHLFQSNP